MQSPHEAHKQIARDAPLLRSLPQKHVEKLLSAAHFKTYARGETIFHQEDTAQAIHIVIDGWVKLYRITPAGTEAVVHVFTRGQSFGEAVALRHRPYPVSGEAVTGCTVMLLPASVLIALMSHDTQVAISVLSSTFAHLHELVIQLEQLKAQTGAQRVAEFLLDLSDAETGCCTVTLPYDKALIAAKLGMKPESLSRAFGRLKKAGVKIEKNHALIEDVETLQSYLEDTD